MSRPLLAVGFVLLALAPPAAAQTKYAVVVGVNKYDDKKLGDLSYAEADADALAKVLRTAGFTVTPLLGKEASKTAITAAVDGVLKKATKDDTLLFAFAGHGQQFVPKGETEDVPFLCPPGCDALKADTLVRLNDLLVRAGDAKVGKALFLVDACRNDPAGARGGVSGNAVSLKAQTVVLFAAANGQKAREHKDAGGAGVGRGLFMSEVIEAVGGKALNDDGEVTWDGLVARVKSGVKRKSRALFPSMEDSQHQTPHQAGSLSGDAVLAAHLWPGEVEYQKGYASEYGVKTVIDRRESLAWFRKSAEKGHPLAKMELADFLRSGHLVEKNVTEAERLEKSAIAQIRKAAELDHPQAQRWLGAVYALGLGGQKEDFGEAAKWYRKAADQGYALAQIDLGGLYESGEGVTKDEAEAVRWYRKAADQGLASCQICLGNVYANGVGVTKDDDEAVKWYRKAAEQGHAEAQNALGVMYVDGRGVAKDDDEAVKWYRKAAEQENANAQYNLGYMYENGYGGLAKSEEEAVRWYRKAAEQNHPVAQNNLGVQYEDGRGGLAKDEVEAAKWYRKAADQGNAVAQVNLGNLYAGGRGVAKDEKEAVKWYQKAADQEDANAQNTLGNVYANGELVAKDEKEAVKWYRKAADQGHADAQNNLGVMYVDGRGVAKDEKEAVEWYQKAADQGNAAAQNNLGTMHENGLGGLAKDVDEAVKWYQKAAEQGNESAKDALKRLDK